MQSRVDELEKIKHHGISGMVQSIQDELRKTGEQDWEMMVSETDARGVLLERRICQELVAVQKDASSNFDETEDAQLIVNERNTGSATGNFKSNGQRISGSSSSHQFITRFETDDMSKTDDLDQTLGFPQLQAFAGGHPKSLLVESPRGGMPQDFVTQSSNQRYRNES